MRFLGRARSLTWPRFLSVLTLSMGLWVTCLFGAYLIPALTGHPDFQNEENGLFEGAALFVFPSLGISSCALSYFLAQRKNWARLTLVTLLLAACAVAVGVVGSRVLAWSFGTPDEIGEFILALGFLLIPLAFVGFLVNDQVAAAFRKSSEFGDRPDANNHLGGRRG